MSGPRQSVILAAGYGQRLGSQDHGVPKPLMEVAGRPLIEYALAQAAAAGCGEAIVVTGNSGDAVSEGLRGLASPLAVTVVANPDFHLPNGVSLLAAERHVEGSFFLQMADHVFGAPVLPVLAAEGGAPAGCLRLLVDRRPVYCDEEDATKVRLRGERISAIGKELTSWDAVDTGCFLLDHRIFDALRKAGPPETQSVTAGMLRLIERDLLSAVELEGVTWVDVDTPLDHQKAQELFGDDGPFAGG